MGLRFKFNIVLLLVVVAGMGVSTVISQRLLHENARLDVLRNAALLMDAAQSVQAYTEQHVAPPLRAAAEDRFLPQVVPAFAATEILGLMRSPRNEFSYREAALNPTNLRNRPIDWEADLIQAFRSAPDLKELTGERGTPSGRQLYLARPIRVDDATCLQCHGSADRAPAAMVKQYGEHNGFGWQLGETVGARIVSVPMTVAEAGARQAQQAFISALASVAGATFIVLNIMLAILVVQPLRLMSRDADRISTGDFEVPEIAAQRRDEVGRLAVSFNRMRRSLEHALKLLDR